MSGAKYDRSILGVKAEKVKKALRCGAVSLPLLWMAWMIFGPSSQLDLHPVITFIGLGFVLIGLWFAYPVLGVSQRMWRTTSPKARRWAGDTAYTVKMQGNAFLKALVRLFCSICKGLHNAFISINWGFFLPTRPAFIKPCDKRQVDKVWKMPAPTGAIVSKVIARSR